MPPPMAPGAAEALGRRAAAAALTLLLAASAAPPARAGWEADYREGREALEAGDLGQALKLLGRAARRKPEEDRKAKSDSTAGRWVHDYYPHYYLGLAHARDGDCEAAAQAWRESLRQGVAPDRVRSDIEQGLRTCGGGGAPAPPRGLGQEEAIVGDGDRPEGQMVVPRTRPGFPTGRTGACCLGRNCVDGVVAESCDGRFAAGESCRTILCYVPGSVTGACCRGERCEDGVTPEQCADGRFVVGGDCGTAPCRQAEPMGACCIFGDCETLSEFDCEALGGRFLGLDADCPRSGACDDRSLGALGGCCLGDTCVELSSASCRDEGGRFLGAGRSCAGARCEGGRRVEKEKPTATEPTRSEPERKRTRLKDDPSKPPRDRAEAWLFGSGAGGDQRAASEAVLRVLGGGGLSAEEEVLLALAHFNLWHLAETPAQSEDHRSHAQRHARLALREGMDPVLLDPDRYAPHFRRWIGDQAR